MPKLVVLTFVTLDGVMQAPGGPEEDPSGGFRFGGWSAPYWDDVLENAMSAQMGHPFDLLLGRKTYDIFSNAWPAIDPQSVINSARKYVATSKPLPPETDIWKNVVPIDENVVESIRNIKSQDGPEIQVHGSQELIQTLLKNDLVDELWLKIYPITLGSGKRLFAEGAIPVAFTLSDCVTSPQGVIVATYVRAGEVKIGSFA